MWPNSQETADLVTFTEEIVNGKLLFLCIKIIFESFWKYYEYVGVYDSISN